MEGPKSTAFQLFVLFISHQDSVSDGWWRDSEEQEEKKEVLGEAVVVHGVQFVEMREWENAFGEREKKNHQRREKKKKDAQVWGTLEHVCVQRLHLYDVIQI